MLDRIFDCLILYTRQEGNCQNKYFSTAIWLCIFVAILKNQCFSLCWHTCSIVMSSVQRVKQVDIWYWRIPMKWFMNIVLNFLSFFKEWVVELIILTNTVTYLWRGLLDSTVHQIIWWFVLNCTQAVPVYWLVKVTSRQRSFSVWLK